VFGAGAAVVSLSITVESTCLSISNLPAEFFQNTPKLMQLLAPFGPVRMCTFSSPLLHGDALAIHPSSVSALVTFDSPGVAEAVRSKLDGASLPFGDFKDPAASAHPSTPSLHAAARTPATNGTGTVNHGAAGRRLQVRILPASTTSSLESGDHLDASTIKVTWEIPSLTVTVVLTPATFHKVFLHRHHMEGTFLGNARITCVLRPGPSDIVLSGFPADSADEDIVPFVRSLLHPIQSFTEISIVRPDVAGSKKVVRSLLERSGGLDSFITPIQDAAVAARGTMVGFARYLTAGDAVTAREKLDGKVVGELGGSRLLVERYFTTKLFALKELIRVIEPQLDAFRASLSAFRGSSRVHLSLVEISPESGHAEPAIDPSGGLIRVMLKLNSADPISLANAKRNLEILLRGEVVQGSNGHPVWDPLMLGPEGLANLRKICKEVGGFVYRDSRMMLLRAFGPPEIRSELQQRILELIRHHRENVGSIQVSRMTLHDVLSFGVDRLARLAGAREISVNAVSCSLQVLPTEKPPSSLYPAGRAASALADEMVSQNTWALISVVSKIKVWISRVEMLRSTDTGDTSVEKLMGLDRQALGAAANVASHCAICFCPAIHSISLACGHECCNFCLRDFLLIQARGPGLLSFPIRCAANGCDFSVPLNLIKIKLAVPELDALLSASLRSYVLEHADLLYFCSTPDCMQVFEDKGNVVDGRVTATPKDSTQDLTAAEEEASIQCPTCHAMVVPPRSRFHNHSALDVLGDNQPEKNGAAASPAKTL
jgi:hypothetical protein